MKDLREMHCVPCEKGGEPFDEEKSKQFSSKISPGWKIVDNEKIVKKFPFDNFKRGMAFAQEVADIAEKEEHHPDICVHYSNVVVELSTHKIGGLSENDFIMAAKIDEL